MNVLSDLGRMFYLIHPGATYEKVEDIPKPNFIQQAIPYFVTFIILEYVVQCFRDKPRTRINDGVTSIAHGMWLLCENLLVRGSEGWLYIYIYENYRQFELPWDSPYTWYIAAILGDLAYYWAHRAGHEINLFWALHQVHHSSEDYNLTTALRQSAFQSWFAWIFYLPMALFLPPPLFLIHQQFNTIYQFWIHTEVIDSIGPLEYILNTPRHHRVHHGCNRYCLDKNYAGVLIIWDKLFGTFQEEQPGTITYGLVEDLNSFNTGWLQFFSLHKIWAKAKTCTGTGDKLAAVFKGPGWFPGTPRLGDPSGVAEYPNRPRYDPKIPMWQSIYVLIHFSLAIVGLQTFMTNELALSQMNVIIFVGTLLYTLTSLGFLLDGKKMGMVTEIVRCVLAVLLLSFGRTGDNGYTKDFLLGFFIVSLLSFILFGIMELVNTESESKRSKKIK